MTSTTEERTADITRRVEALQREGIGIDFTALRVEHVGDYVRDLLDYPEDFDEAWLDKSEALVSEAEAVLARSKLTRLDGGQLPGQLKLV